MKHVRNFPCLFLAAALLAGCATKHSGDDEASDSNVVPVVAVKAVPIVRGRMETVLAVTGKTEALRKEKIYSPVAGTIVALRVLEGSVVHRGDVVAVVQPRETRAAIVGAEASLRAAHSESEKQEARKALDLARSNQNNVDIRASTGGTVAARMVTEGELVTENAELITVVDLSTVVFVADVPLRNLREVKTGEEATVQGQSLPGKSFRATVEAISPHADLPSQSVKARLRFRGEGGEARRLLKTEMSGIARIITGVHQGVLIVPKSAILRDDETNTYSIVVVTPDTLARTVPVSVMASSESDVEVQGNGLQPGTLVVVEGNYALADSTKLSVGD